MSEDQDPPEAKKDIPVRKSSDKKFKKKVVCSWYAAPGKKHCDFEASDENQMIAHIRHAHRGSEYEPPEDEEEEEDLPPAEQLKKEAGKPFTKPPVALKPTTAAEVLKMQTALAKDPDEDAQALKKMKDVLYLLGKLHESGMRLSDEQTAWLQITSTILSR